MWLSMPRSTTVRLFPSIVPSVAFSKKSHDPACTAGQAVRSVCRLGIRAVAVSIHDPKEWPKKLGFYEKPDAL